jgi:hypothetical protein
MMEVRVVLSVNGWVTVTKVVISGPENDVGLVVVLEFGLAVLLGKKAPGTLVGTVPFGKKGILRLVELDMLDDVREGEEQGKEKGGLLKAEEAIEVKRVVVKVSVLLGR